MSGQCTPFEFEQFRSAARRSSPSWVPSHVMRETNTMNDPIHKCASCGSGRVVSGKFNVGTEGDAGFEFSELKKEHYGTTVHNTPRTTTVRDDGSAKVCLDCGKVTASMSVDAKEAEKALNQWGTDALKARLAVGPPMS